MVGQTKAGAKSGKVASKRRKTATAKPTRTAKAKGGRKIQGASAKADTQLGVLSAKVRAQFVKTCNMQNLDPIKTLNKAAANFNELFA